MHLEPGDVLEGRNHNGDTLIVLVLRRYPYMYGQTEGDYVDVLWLMGHTNPENGLVSRHHADIWNRWQKICGSD